MVCRPWDYQPEAVKQQAKAWPHEVGEVIGRVVPTHGFSERDSMEILQEMKAAVGGRLKVDVVTVDEIPRTKQGKYKFLEQKLNVKFGD